MTDLPTQTAGEDGGKLEGEKRQPLQIATDRSKLHQSDSLWGPEMERLSEQVANEIEQRLASLPDGEEVLIAEISGFPGLSQICALRSSAAMGTDNIRHLAPDRIVELLRSKGIPAEIAYRQDSQPRNFDTKVMIRQFNDHDEGSYAMDPHPPVGALTSSYQRSKLQYFVRKVQPKEQSVDAISAGRRVRAKLRKWLGR